MSRLIAYTVPELAPATPWAILRDLASGHVKHGSSVARLEKAVAEYIGARYAVAFPSARAALFSAYKAVGCAGRRVLLPSYTCIAAIDAVRWAGGVPIFADIELNSYNPVFSGRFRKIKNLGAISLSYLYGLVGDIQMFLDFADYNGIKIVEDSAIALGGSYGGRMLGSIGDVGVFSLQESKIITGWRGGIATTNRKRIYEKLLASRGGAYPPLPKLVFNLSFSFARRMFSYPRIYKPTMYALKKLMTSGPMLGLLSKAMSFNPMESIDARSPEIMPAEEAAALANMQASVALLSMRRIERIVKTRRAMARVLSEELGSTEGVSVPAESGKSRHAYGRFPVRIEGMDKFKVIPRLLKLGVEASPNYPYICPCTEHMRPYGFREKDYPNALKASKETFLLPFHTLLTDRDLARIADAVRKVVSLC